MSRSQPRKSCLNRLFSLTGCAVFLCILGVIGVAQRGSQPPTRTPSTSARHITTDKGRLTVPGTAYMDGIDPDALQPTTVMRINLWNAPRRTRAVCTLTHGTLVTLTDAEYAPDEERYYFLVKSATCSGWVSQPFVSEEYRAPVGERQ